MPARSHPAAARFRPGDAGGVPHLLAALVMLLAGAIAPAAWAQPSEGVHAAFACSRCHPVDAAGVPLAPTRTVAPQETLCGACHDETGDAEHAISHPVGFVPARPLPPAYPLDADGRFTCGSCHDPHGAAPSLLRSGGGWACADCHWH